MFEDVYFVDLTHNLSEQVPTWSGSCGFSHEVKANYSDGGFLIMKYTMHAGIGTHIDAPVHHIEGGKSISELELEKFFCPCAVINVTEKRSENLAISVDDLLEYEKKNGKIKAGSLVDRLYGMAGIFL